jgi:hypothetical protein
MLIPSFIIMSKAVRMDTAERKGLIYIYTNSKFDISFHHKISIPRIAKVKSIPLQAWTGPQGSRRVRFPDFKTIGT